MIQFRPPESDYTVADLTDLLRPMPFSRILQQPTPGAATEDDVLQLKDRDDRLCELVDGVLVEKTVGAYESYCMLDERATLDGGSVLPGFSLELRELFADPAKGAS